MNHKLSLQMVEPSEIVVEGLRSILAAEDFNILAVLRDAATLKDRLPVIAPDIVLINPTVMGSMARQMMAEMLQARPQMTMAALVYEYVEPQVLQLFDVVVDIRMPRNKIAAELRSKVKVTEPAQEAGENYELSERELDVLVQVAKGLSSKEIADCLNISIHTVNSHRKNITRKTGIRSVAGLAVYAMLNNLM